MWSRHVFHEPIFTEVLLILPWFGGLRSFFHAGTSGSNMRQVLLLGVFSDVPPS